MRLTSMAVMSSCVLLLAGCGGGESDAPKTVSVEGLVTFKGTPMSNLSVAFIPDQGMVAEGTTDAEGRFTLTTSAPNDGAVPGNYKVAVSFVPTTVPEMPDFPGSENNEKSPIPDRYGDASTSGLTATVDADASKNDFKFELVE